MPKSCAIMQPYIFPYLGYFQLVCAADKFIFLDDVGFIKQGWIHRNNILLNKRSYRFTIPIQNSSSNVNIAATLVSEKPNNWHFKLLETIRHAYKKTHYFESVYPLIENVFLDCSNKSVSSVAIKSIQSVLEYVGIDSFFWSSSTIYNNQNLKLEPRIINICEAESATIYMNAVGGQKFLKKEIFNTHNIKLNFVKPTLEPYSQNATQFQAGLSIIDVLMYNSPKNVKEMLYEGKCS